MSLVKILASQVAKTTQNRGWDYYRRRAVSIIEASEDSIDAEVRGAEVYVTNLTLHDDHIHCGCTCPRYEETYEACKHIWATLIAAEAKYLTARWKVDPSAELMFDDLTDSDDVDEEDDELDDDDRFEDHLDELDNVRPSGRPVKETARPLSWKRHFDSLRQSMQSAERQQQQSWRPGKEILYIIDAQQSYAAGEIFVNTATREPKKNGWKQIRPEGISHSQIAGLPDPSDRQILLQLLGAPRAPGYYPYEAIPTSFRISDQLFTTLIPLICSSGRCRLRLTPDATELRPLQWDNGEPWQFGVEVRPDDAGKQYVVTGGLRRGDERMDVCQPVVVFRQGILLTQDSIARVEILDAFQWIALLREAKSFTLPAKQMDAWFKELLRIPYLPRLDLPEELRFEEVTAVAEPRLRVKTAKQFWGTPILKGSLSFVYEGIEVAENAPGQGVPDPERRRRIVRDRAAEDAAGERMKQVGFRKDNYAESGWQMAPTKLPKAIRNLVREGWRVEAEGKLFRRPGSVQMEVNSGVDWFELRGTVQFDDREAPLPALLAALKRGHTSVELGDGTFGILPEDWLKKYGMLAGLGTPEDDHLRFSRSQVGILDALLAAQPEATCDAVFARAREQIRGFGGIEAVDPPAGFSGQLRGYQRDGLGWLHFVRQFGFGGCLADDMGLGKTVQVLALLEARRELRASDETAADRPAPSLVVVPKSLVFNWKQEATRFAPGLRVLEHTGGDRRKGSEHFENYDVILTTYGTLRRDALHFKDVQFDYVILDEAQAIKNANTESAKAARLLRGGHRLALSGTPVQNHLGELWSLFEFLNPGMLGSASVFRLGEGEMRKPDEHARGLLAAALRPFILRRTKDQVAKDLPQKLEQTLYCELEPVQRKLYDELREHYRRSLLGRIDAEGLAKSKMHILEALLRLRQAACHPGLIDKTRIGDPSAKVDMLLPRLAEVRAEGHKTLVFSQFTSFLAIVRQRLEQEKIPYEYLDGQTQDRAAPVERFQTDPESKLFLISLKAGGLGLNLTAAEYVFLLDPWWNPAVEAQAIDRTHRIGQTKKVFAYRLIAQGTVEEKVLELQQTKQHLADAIINADNSLIRELRREDLELLLS